MGSEKPGNPAQPYFWALFEEEGLPFMNIKPKT